jgi:hypothetical protein
VASSAFLENGYTSLYRYVLPLARRLEAGSSGDSNESRNEASRKRDLYPALIPSAGQTALAVRRSYCADANTGADTSTGESSTFTTKASVLARFFTSEFGRNR